MEINKNIILSEVLSESTIGYQAKLMLIKTVMPLFITDLR